MIMRLLSELLALQPAAWNSVLNIWYGDCHHDSTDTDKSAKFTAFYTHSKLNRSYWIKLMMMWMQTIRKNFLKNSLVLMHSDLTEKQLWEIGYYMWRNKLSLHHSPEENTGLNKQNILGYSEVSVQAILDWNMLQYFRHGFSWKKEHKGSCCSRINGTLCLSHLTFTYFLILISFYQYQFFVQCMYTWKLYL